MCECETVSLDVGKRELEVFNFTVTAPKTEKNEAIRSLRVRRFSMKWDSYLKPCIDIEIDDIDICVEFLNILLTKTNWNVLQDAGFPPKLLIDDSSDETSSGSTFVRFGGIKFGGEVKLQIRSRPLDQKLCEDIVFDLQMLDDFSRKVNEVATKDVSSKEKGGRKGCTTEELYDIIEKYFRKKTQKIVKETAMDIINSKLSSNTDSQTVRNAKRTFIGVKDNVSIYARKVRDKTSNQMEQVVSQKLENWNLDASLLDAIKRRKKDSSRDEGEEDIANDAMYEIVSKIGAKMEEKVQTHKDNFKIPGTSTKSGQKPSDEVYETDKRNTDDHHVDISFADW